MKENKMTVEEAIKEVKDGIIPGVRGVGCAPIHMADGRVYYLSSEYTDLVECFSGTGDLVERLDACDVEGDVDRVDWTVDELGGTYC